MTGVDGMTPELSEIAEELRIAERRNIVLARQLRDQFGELEEARAALRRMAGDRPELPEITDEAVEAFWVANTQVWRGRAPIGQDDAVLVNRDATRAGLVAALSLLSTEIRAAAYRTGREDAARELSYDPGRWRLVPVATGNEPPTWFEGTITVGGDPTAEGCDD